MLKNNNDNTCSMKNVSMNATQLKIVFADKGFFFSKLIKRKYK